MMRVRMVFTKIVSLAKLTFCHGERASAGPSGAEDSSPGQVKRSPGQRGHRERSPEGATENVSRKKTLDLAGAQNYAISYPGAAPASHLPSRFAGSATRLLYGRPSGAPSVRRWSFATETRMAAKRSPFLLATALFLVAVPAPSLAQGICLTLDPADTHIDFTLSDVLHTVHGSFKLKAGTISLDPATGKAEGRITVDAASGDSGSGARDRKMHKDVLESGRYPEFVFVPVRVQGSVADQGESRVELQGVLTMHGSSHQMTMVVSARIAGDRLTASSRFVVPYEEWGMKNPSTFILRVSDKVIIDIRASGRLTVSTDHP